MCYLPQSLQAQGQMGYAPRLPAESWQLRTGDNAFVHSSNAVSHRPVSPPLAPAAGPTFLPTTMGPTGLTHRASVPGYAYGPDNRHTHRDAVLHPQTMPFPNYSAPYSAVWSNKDSVVVDPRLTVEKCPPRAPIHTSSVLLVSLHLGGSRWKLICTSILAQGGNGSGLRTPAPCGRLGRSC